MITLQIETRGNCNARCHFCPYPKTMNERAGLILADKYVYKLLDDAAQSDKIKIVIFHGLNEPLLDKRLEDFTRYIKTKRPDITVVIFTNGVFLTPKRFESLKAAGLGSLVVSLNAVSQEQHERIMGLKGKFATVVDNCRYAIAHLDGMDFGVHAVVNDDTFTERDGVEFLRAWGISTMGGHGLCVREGNWAGDNRTTYTFKPNEWCSRATTSIYVTCEGTVTACCFDPYGKLDFGNIKEQSLADIYSGEKYVRFRQDHVNDEADKWEICKNCTRI